MTYRDYDVTIKGNCKYGVKLEEHTYNTRTPMEALNSCINNTVFDIDAKNSEDTVFVISVKRTEDVKREEKPSICTSACDKTFTADTATGTPEVDSPATKCAQDYTSSANYVYNQLYSICTHFLCLSKASNKTINISKLRDRIYSRLIDLYAEGYAVRDSLGKVIDSIDNVSVRVDIVDGFLLKVWFTRLNHASDRISAVILRI
jgi:hypothetical protein